MTSQQNNFGTVHYLCIDKKGFWDLGLGEIFTGLGMSRQEIKDGGGFVNASVRKFAAGSKSSLLEEHTDEKTGKPYLRLIFAISMRKSKLSDLSAQEIATGLSLSSAERKEQGGFVKASVTQTHKSSRSVAVVGA